MICPLFLSLQFIVRIYWKAYLNNFQNNPTIEENSQDNHGEIGTTIIGLTIGITHVIPWYE